jgi:hypothetical protein
MQDNMSVLPCAKTMHVAQGSEVPLDDFEEFVRHATQTSTH